MQALRREDQAEADVLIAGMLTELWDALFVEEKQYSGVHKDRSMSEGTRE